MGGAASSAMPLQQLQQQKLAPPTELSGRKGQAEDAQDAEFSREVDAQRLAKWSHAIKTVLRRNRGGSTTRDNNNDNDDDIANSSQQKDETERQSNRRGSIDVQKVVEDSAQLQRRNNFVNDLTVTALDHSPRESALMSPRNPPTVLSNVGGGEDSAVGKSLAKSMQAMLDDLEADLLDKDDEEPGANLSLLSRKGTKCSAHVLFSLLPLYDTGDVQLDQLVEDSIDKVSVDEPDMEGNTMLIKSAESGKCSLAERLLVRGAGVNKQNTYGFAALHYASYQASASLGMAKLLLESGADPNIVDQSRCSPLHYAAAEGNVALVGLLLFHKASTTIKDSLGHTPLSYAEQIASEKCVKLLQGTTLEASSTWRLCTDQATKRTYYFNLDTGETSWDLPLEFRRTNSNNAQIDDGGVEIADDLLDWEIPEDDLEAELLDDPDNRERWVHPPADVVGAQTSVILDPRAEDADNGSQQHSNNRERRKSHKPSSKNKKKREGIHLQCRIRSSKVDRVRRTDAHTIFVESLNSALTGFDVVWEPGASQREVVEAFAPHVKDAVMEATDLCVVALGGPASGKSFTLLGTPRDPGCITACAEVIFALKSQHDLSFTAVMKEFVAPSISSSSFKAKKKKSKAGGVDLVEETLVPAFRPLSCEELCDRLRSGMRQCTGNLAFNTRGSNSHVVTTLEVKHVESGKKSRVVLVDLAAPQLELAKLECVNEDRLGRAEALDGSTKALLQVLRAKDRRKKRVDFGKSVLTRALESSMEGKVVVSVHLEPSSSDDMRRTLSSAQKVRVKPLKC